MFYPVALFLILAVSLAARGQVFGALIVLALFALVMALSAKWGARP